MELKEGIYIRVLGQIRKIIKFDENILHFDEPIDYWGERETWVSVEDFIKFKGRCEENITDLIEERDFVKVRIDNIFINWFMVDLFEEENENQELGIGCYEDGLLNSISEYRPLNTLEILEVATKEQFEIMSYKVKE